MNDMTLGEIIYTLRKRQKMSQGELAKKAGVSRNLISALERDCENATLSTLQSVCEALGYVMDVRLKEKTHELQG